MDPIIIIIALAVIAALMAITLIATYICFRMAFYSPKRKQEKKTKSKVCYNVPVGDEYAAFREDFRVWREAVSAMPCDNVEIKSYDGLTLHARYYEYAPGAPLEIMFHGYRGDAFRDLCGGVERCFKLGHNTLIVDHRACGESEGSVITFGYKERMDCLNWINYSINRFGKDLKILITGISMGGATVLMASGEELPENVVGIIEDCSYTTTKEMICKTIKGMHLPVKLAYPFVRLGGIIWGDFDPDLSSPIEAVKRATVPIMFIHGESDNFIPLSMCDELYEACPTPKMRLTVKGAGHGLSFPKDQESYYKAVREFKQMIGL